MIKFFTILFLIYYTVRLFTPCMFKNTFNSFTKKSKENSLITDENERKKHLVSMFPETIKMLIISFFILIPISIAEVIYIFSAVQYGDKLITVGFIIWGMFLLLAGVIKTKIQKSNGDLYKEIKKVSLWGILVNIIDIAYFGYMYFILFLK